MMFSSESELDALNKSDDITLYHDNFTDEKSLQNNGTQDSTKIENKSGMSSQQSSDLQCQTQDKENAKQVKEQLFKLMAPEEISDNFNGNQFEEATEKTEFFPNEISKESKPPVVLFTEIQKKENENSFGKSTTEPRKDLTEHDYSIHTTKNNDELIKQVESLHKTLLLPNLDEQQIKPERSQIVDGLQVHFASPLFVYHEYSISECSSRTETMDSDSSMEILESEIRSDESYVEKKTRGISKGPLEIIEESMESKGPLEVLEESMENKGPLEESTESYGPLEVLEDYMEMNCPLEVLDESLERKVPLEVLEKSMESKGPLEVLEESIEIEGRLEVLEESMESKGPLEVLEKSMESKGPLEVLEESMESKGPLEVIEKSIERKGPLEVIGKSMELSTNKFEKISDTSSKVFEDDLDPVMRDSSISISTHTVIPSIYNNKLSEESVQVVPSSSFENKMVNDSECPIPSDDSSQEDKIISEVRNTLENLIVQCCDINDVCLKNNFEVKCTPEPNCDLSTLRVSFEEKGISQFSLNKKVLETFSDLNGHEVRQVVTKDLTKFDIDELDEAILLNSNQQQSSDNINFENSVSEELSSTENSKLEMIEFESSINLETENNMSQMGDSANISNTPNYSDKAKLLKEENEEKVSQIWSPKCLESKGEIEESEIAMSSCDNQVTSISLHSQQSVEEQPNSQLQIFDSEIESSESETEMNASCIQVEEIKPLIGLNAMSNSNENDEISESEASVDQCIINFENTRKGDGHLNNNKSEKQDLCAEAQKDGDNCYSISTEEVEQFTNVTMVFSNENEGLKTDHEHTFNGKDDHIDEKQNISKEFPADFTDLPKSDLTDNDRQDDTTSIQISKNVLKNYNLDKDQESNVPITESNIDFNGFSNSKNQQQELNPCYESSESIVINKQLDLHLNAVSEDAKLQVQESTSINQNDEERIIKVNENHLSSNYLQTNQTKGRLYRKRSVNKTDIEDGEPSAKVSTYHSISEGLDQYKYTDVGLVYKEGIQHGDSKLSEPVDIKMTEELHYNDKQKDYCAKEQMDQTVPYEIDCGVKLATETLYSQQMDKKEDYDMCPLDMKGDGKHILPEEMSEDYICRETNDLVGNSMAFKWKYVPSIDLTDSVVPNCEEEKEANSLLPAPMKTCKKPYRLGLSKRQKLSSLHPKLKRV
ncbi:putative leucine-rich repeat-containing protein DDB_G0290503 [Mytilus edulis]|uniref:putative leucine-rich repeat-containing protein DDB_G0290503 n=1 Tax=Mytilus edulis TaxID=6550 RepID=UPI0039F0CDD6